LRAREDDLNEAYHLIATVLVNARVTTPPSTHSKSPGFNLWRNDFPVESTNKYPIYMNLYELTKS